MSPLRASDEVLADLVEGALPGARLVAVVPLTPDPAEAVGRAVEGGESAKRAGYGRPLKLTAVRDGEQVELVLHFAAPDCFGHQRRADRAASQVLAFDTFGMVPSHVPALDLGVRVSGGAERCLSLRGAGEFYLLTPYVAGKTYAERLREIASAGRAGPADVAEVEALGAYLATLHALPAPLDASYRRAVRDLVGHGEGIFGMVDGYPEDTPGVTGAKLQRLEQLALEWRWRLRGYEHRLVRTHGDFHPFNIISNGGELTFLDASRGCGGEAADDVTALAVNFPFFALGHREAGGAMGHLARRFFEAYQAKRRDPELFDVAPPFFAWRALVVSHPAFYPALTAEHRSFLLDAAEQVMVEGRLEVEMVQGWCRGA